MSRRRAVAPGQGDLFAAASAGSLFPVRRPAERDRPVDVLRIKTAMGQALKASPDTAEVVAAKIAAMTGEEMSVDALYTYTAPGKPDRTMSIARFVAFVRVTGAFWLWDLLVEDDGLTVLEGREANHVYMLALYFAFYNFCRIHKTLRVTPAMAAGIDSTVHDMDWIVGMIDAAAPKPNRPARYNQAKAIESADYLNTGVTIEMADRRKPR